MRNNPHGIQQLTAEELHAHDTSRRIDREVLLEQKQIVGEPEVRAIAEKTLEFVGGVNQIHPRAAPALLRFKQSRPAISPLRKHGIDVVEDHADRMTNSQAMHQRTLCGLAQFQSEGARAVQYPRTAGLQRAHERQGQWYGPRVTAHIRAGAGLIEVDWGVRARIGIERPLLQIVFPEADAAALQSREQWLLPVGVFEQNYEIMCHRK